MNDTHYHPINSSTLLQERRYISRGDVFECAGEFLITGFMDLDQPGMMIPNKNRQSTIPASKHLLWFMPPWSIFHYRCDFLQVHTRAHIFRFEDATAWNRFAGPIIAPAINPGNLPTTLADLPAWLELFSDYPPLYSENDLSPVTRKAKKSIENQFGEAVTLGEIARMLKFNPTVMGRHFKRDFGLTPKHYQNRLRIIDSIAHMLAGITPSDAGFLAGFNDVSRFYKQFKKIASRAPAQYVAESKNAKTD